MTSVNQQWINQILSNSYETTKNKPLGAKWPWYESNRIYYEEKHNSKWEFLTSFQSVAISLLIIIIINKYLFIQPKKFIYIKERKILNSTHIYYG